MAPAQEIKEYLIKFAGEYDLYKHIEFERRVESAAWLEEESVWVVVTNKGMVRCRILVSACGALHKPSLPSIPGIQSFSGPSFHSSCWDDSAVLADKVVGVVGSAASAAQLVPAIVGRVREVFVFQRTPNWFFPKLDLVYPGVVRYLFRVIPGLMTLQRMIVFLLLEAWVMAWLTRGRLSRMFQVFIEGSMRSQIGGDKHLATQLIPTYSLGCKRVLFSDDFLPVFKNNSKCHLVTDSINYITTDGVTTNKEDIKLDIIVYATGFDIENSICSFHTTGRNHSVLRDHFANNPCAYHGITVPSFPNYFILLGPNTVAHNSLVWMIECQVEYVMKTIQKMVELHISSVEPRQDKTREFQDKMGEWSKTKNFSSSCRSWAKTKDGINFVLWPSNLLHYWWMTNKPHLLEDYKIGFESEYYSL